MIHLPRRSSKNCDLQFANNDRFKANYNNFVYRLLFQLHIGQHFLQGRTHDAPVPRFQCLLLSEVSRPCPECFTHPPPPIIPSHPHQVNSQIILVSFQIPASFPTRVKLFTIHVCLSYKFYVPGMSHSPQNKHASILAMQLIR